jgi:hypothetical protein
MAAASVPETVEEINKRLSGMAEIGARSAMARILAALKCSTTPKVSTGKVGNKTARFYDYGEVKVFGDHLVLVAGPDFVPTVILGSEISHSGQGIYIATIPDSKAQAEATAAAEKASVALEAPAPKKAATPKAATRKAPAPKKPAVDMEAFRAARAAGRASYEAKKAAAEAERQAELARAHEAKMSRFRDVRAAGKAQYEAKKAEREQEAKMSAFRDVRAKGRAQYESRKAAGDYRPKVDQAAAMSEAQTLIAALKAMKKGK